MEQNFIKFYPELKKSLGCSLAALILEKSEYWFRRYPNGFYKFMEPCSHKLYKKGESWVETLGCHRTTFWRSFNLIGKKHPSRWGFDQAKDKFDGKLYASYYDRYTNRMYFIRNHTAANEFLCGIWPSLTTQPVNRSTWPGDNINKYTVGTEQNAHSYIEAKNTSIELSNDNSHAGNLEVIKKMVEVWTAIVEQGKKILTLTSKRIAFLRQAMMQKFNNSLEQWTDYCKKVASSKFLMGECRSSSFRATLDWALKFEIIQKILEGYYGIGDRARELGGEEIKHQQAQQAAQEDLRQKQKLQALEAAEQQIRKTYQGQAPAINFRVSWVRRFGMEDYSKSLGGCQIKLEDGGRFLTLMPSCRLQAKHLVSYGQKLEALLATAVVLGVRVYHTSEFVGLDGKAQKLEIDKWFGQRVSQDLQHHGPRSPLWDGYPSAIAIKEKGRQPYVNERGGAFIRQQTEKLQEYLKEKYPHAPKQFLEKINFVRVDGDRIVVLSFDDALSARFYQKQYQAEILEAAQELWKVCRVTVISGSKGLYP